jgi:hypothetical protein
MSFHAAPGARSAGIPIMKTARFAGLTPYPRRRLSWAVLLSLVLAGAAMAQSPPPGRYRCYQPPAYTVMAWFDLAAGRISVHGDTPQPVRIDAATGRIELPPDALPPWRHGIHFAPGAKEGDAERFTIVLASRAEHRPGHPSWARLPRCYLTTH